MIGYMGLVVFVIAAVVIFIMNRKPSTPVPVTPTVTVDQLYNQIVAQLPSNLTVTQVSMVKAWLSTWISNGNT